MLAGFGITAPPARVPGGRGVTWRAAGAILKPTADPADTQELADIVARVPADPRYRVAQPVRATDGRSVIDGWSAWTWLEGEHRSDRWPELLVAAAAFHESLAGVRKPAFVDRLQDRWRKADRVAWGESSWVPFAAVAHVERLVAARRPVTSPSQLVHCDLVGNVLFADGLPPGIIDHSLYWRPAGYGAAVAVGDAIAWEGAGSALTRLLEVIPSWRQLLLRAILFRVITNAIARGDEPARADLSAEYQDVVDLAVSLADQAE